MKYSHSKAMAVFYKIVKLAKNGVLMIIHIYAKVSNNTPKKKLNYHQPTYHISLLVGR
jgi:phage-related protein